jgi:hypothetical protein
MQKNTVPYENITKTLQVGIVAGIVSATVGNIIGTITQYLAQNYFAETSIASITLFSLCAGVVLAIVYYLLRWKLWGYCHDIFTVIGLTVPTVVTLNILAGPYDATFRIIGVSTSFAVCFTCVILIPWLADRHGLDPCECSDPKHKHSRKD